MTGYQITHDEEFCMMEEYDRTRDAHLKIITYYI